MYGERCPSCNQKLMTIYIRTGLSGVFRFRCEECCIDFDYKRNVVRSWNK